MSWLFLSIHNSTVGQCEAWPNNSNCGEGTEDLWNPVCQQSKFTFFIKKDTYEIISFRQRKLNLCVVKGNCCIETKDWINWIIGFTCLLSQDQTMDVQSIRVHSLLFSPVLNEKWKPTARFVLFNETRISALL